MKMIVWILKRSLKFLLFRPRIWRENLNAWRRFWHSYDRYLGLVESKEQANLIKYLYPCLGDDTNETPIEPTYFYQDTWAFEKILAQRPDNHIDVGSHHTFVTFLSKVLPVTMVDIRPLSLPVNTLHFQQGSILDLPFESNSIESLSSLCVVEHIGLGRYGDPLDPKGTEKAIYELQRTIKPKGHLYISLPIDDENRTYFNAHRAFSEQYIMSLFSGFQVIDKAYIYGRQLLTNQQSGFGTALYHLQKLVND
ncbi:MAG: hypothetical protein N5P05_003590 [Chroococcopsis gigantea SAG 12.99]|jgi:SAM-dependent methyltransferase|nr:hypothetical protein [Chroococcopsis gigantea SAG 12.99]